ncbi:MAG: universal stress protein [Anaerolineales bacterium]|nr:MAG: universal stress protein [Anaerolineales bacterium]
MYKKVLVPLDGSKLAEVALQHVEQLAWELGSSLILLRVVRPPRSVEYPWPEKMMALNQELEAGFKREARSYLAARRGELSNKNVEASTHIMVSEDVANAILDYSEQERVDLIAMSTHGRSGVGRWVYGSVAERVLRGATCPVLLIRAKREGQ